MNSHLLDGIILAAYLGFSFIFGIFASKLLHSSAKNEEDYFLAGRKMPGWLNGASYAVTAINADVAPVYVGMACVLGLSVCWFFISRFALGFMIIAALFAIKWRQLGVSTGPEFFALRFGGHGGKFVRCYSSIYAVMVGMVPWIGAGLLGLHMIVGPIFGIESKVVTISIVLPILLAYVWISGFAGVVVTDVLHTTIIILANIVLIIAVLFHFGGPTGLANSIIAAQGSAAKDIFTLTPIPDHRVFGPLMVVAWFLACTVGTGGNVGVEGQRVLSCKNHTEAAKVGVWSEIVLFIMLLSLTLPALAIMVDYPKIYYSGPSERETAYGLLLSGYLPVGLLGLALAALAASVMSSVSGFLNYGSQTLVNDVYRTLGGKVSNKNAVWLGRLFMILIQAVALLVVYFSNSLIGIAVVLMGLFGSTGAMAWAQWWWYRINFYSWLSANVAGPVVYFSLTVILKQIPWWQQQSAISESMAQQLQMMQAIVSMVITTAIWVTVTFLTKPEKMELLKEFYRRAKPLGAWGPVRQAVIADDPDFALKYKKQSVILPGLGVALLGVSWIAVAVLAISSLFIGRYRNAVMLGIASAILALCFKYAFGWHIRRMSDSETQTIAEKPVLQEQELDSKKLI